MAASPGAPQPDRLAAGEVVVRSWTADDGPELTAVVLASLDHLRPWMPWAHPGYGEADSQEFLSKDHGVDWSLAITVAGCIAGGIGLHDRLGPGAWEIGYWVAETEVRRGRASTAAALVTEAALGWPGIERIEIHHDRANTASRGVPARLGYRLVREVERDPVAPADGGIECHWVVEREEWPASAGARLLAAARAHRP